MSCEEIETSYTRQDRSPESSERSFFSNESLTRTLSDSSNSQASRSSMTVRTLEESINGVKLVKTNSKRWKSKSMNSENFSMLHCDKKSSFERRSKSLSCDSYSKLWGKKKLSSNRKSTVQFGDVMIHEHPVIPGDNPSVPDGPPLAIDWTAFNNFSVAVNRFEEFREGNRRSDFDLRIPTETRTAFLIQEENDAEDIVTAANQAAASRYQRFQTIKALRSHTLESLAA